MTRRIPPSFLLSYNQQNSAVRRKKRGERGEGREREKELSYPLTSLI